MKKDMVNHPSHYISDNGIEVIDVIEAFTKGLDGIEATDTGNIIKYICRWKDKNGLEDLKKCQWYINHLINHIEESYTDENAEPDYIFANIGFTDKKVCESVLRAMQMLIAIDDQVSVAQLSNLGCPSRIVDEVDYYFGWTDLTDITISQSKSMFGTPIYLIDLPTPIKLK